MRIPKLLFIIQTSIVAFFLGGTLIIAFTGGRFFPLSDFNLFAHSINKDFIVIYRLKASVPGGSIYLDMSLPKPMNAWFVTEFYTANRSNPERLKTFFERMTDEVGRYRQDVSEISFVRQKLKPVQDRFLDPYRFEVIDEQTVFSHPVSR